MKRVQHPVHWSHGNAGELAAGSNLLGLTGFLPWNTPRPEGRSFSFSKWGMSSGFLSRVRSVVCCPASMLPFLEAARFVLSLGYPLLQKKILRQGFGCKLFWGQGIPPKLCVVVGTWWKPIRGGLIRSVWVLGDSLPEGLWEVVWTTYPTRG